MRDPSTPFSIFDAPRIDIEVPSGVTSGVTATKVEPSWATAIQAAGSEDLAGAAA